MEREFRIHFLPTIRTLSSRQASTRRFADQRRTPPLIPAPTSPAETLIDGFYVSQSGINGLEYLYDQALSLPGRAYTNRVHESVPKDQIIPPRFIAHPSIKWVYARAAWNTIWLTNLTSTPMVCPSHQTGDHPEIYFNLQTVEHLGLAAVWERGRQPLGEFLEGLDTGELVSKQRAVYTDMLSEFGTLDGIEYCSQQIVKDYLQSA